MLIDYATRETMVSSRQHDSTRCTIDTTFRMAPPPTVTPGSEPMFPELQAGVLAEIAPTIIMSVKNPSPTFERSTS